MSTLSVATIKSQNTLPPAVQNSSGTEIGTFCRAWVNFNGTGTVAIRASFNVTSITDNGAGDYTANFTTAMSDANYSWTVSGHRGDSAGQNGGFSLAYATTSNAYTSATTTSLRVITQGAAGTAGLDWPAVCVNIFR
jgi:hypothetical protein